MIDEIKAILGSTLGLGDRADTLTAATPLIGSIPEFDSMAVVSVITALEEQYGIVVEDDEVSAETFETVGTLSDFIESKLSA